MIESLIYTSENDNSYVYDNQRKLSMLIHPDLKNVYEASTKVDPYYIKKYAYLKKHGFFTKSKLTTFKTVVDESMLEKGIIQTKQVVFEVTDSCNLKCSYCVQGELYKNTNKSVNKKIDATSAVNLLKYLFDLKHKNKETRLNISFYGGEPLLNIRFVKQIVELSKQLSNEKKISVTYLMTTNATLIHKCIDFLVENKFKLMVSLDGNNVNHSYRVFGKNNKNSFPKVIENLDMIRKEYPNYFDNYISFNSVLHNKNSIGDIYKFIYEKYNKIPQISELASENINIEKEILFKKIFQSKRKSEMEFQKEESALLNITHQESLLYDELTDFLKYYSINHYMSNLIMLLHDEKDRIPTNTCLPFSIKIFLTNRNQLLACEKINYKYSMGKMTPNVVIDIPKIARQLNSYYEHFGKKCQNCYVQNFCGLCMFRLDNLGKSGTDDFVCERFHDQKTFQTKLHRVFSFLEKNPKDFIEILENVILTS